jgi:winged helix-turn helix protein
MLAEVRMGRLVDAIVRHRAGELGCEAAAELLGLSERHFRRLRDRYEEDGPDGVVGASRGAVRRWS